MAVQLGASAGNATAADVLSGTTFSNATQQNVSGTIPIVAGGTIDPATTTQTAIAGATYTSGDINVAPVSGTATAAEVLSGATFASANGIGLTGSMANNGSLSYTPNGNSQSIPAGYTSGGTINPVSVKVVTGTATSALTYTWVTPSGTETDQGGVSIPVPSGASAILGVIAQEGMDTTVNNTTGGYTFASPSGSADGINATTLAVANNDITGSNISVIVEAGGSLTLSPSGIVVPLANVGSGTNIAYTVYYI